MKLSVQKVTVLLTVLASTAGVVSSLSAPSTRRNVFRVGAAAVTGYVANLVTDRSANADDLTIGGKIVLGEESLMDQKGHGTTVKPVQANLRYGVDNKLADKICCYNRHFAEFSNSFLKTSFEDDVLAAKAPITFYDSVTGKPLFVAPIGRSAESFLEESEAHGWPSFRDQEVVWENVRVLKSSGETVSVDGTHLGHNLPDRRGNRYCINLVSVAGNPLV